MTSAKKTTGLFISFIFGGVVGSAIALLYAPKPGRNLRDDISRKTNEFIEEGRKKTFDTWNDAKELAENTFESTLDNANDVLNKNVDRVMRKTEKVKDAFKSGYNAYKDERKSGNNKSSLYSENLENTQRERS